MKRLFIIWLFMMGAFAAKAQTLQVFGPDSICLSSYATFDAVLFTSNGNSTLTPTSYSWSFSPVQSTIIGNTPTSRNLTVTFANTGTVTATCKVTYNNTTYTASKQMKILLCQSSTCLGTSSPTPFFTENFGSKQGANNYWYLGQNGSSGTTTYAQGSVGSVQDGQYIVTDSPYIAKSNWAVIGDHTGNPGGGMMVINADYAPGIFYTRTVTGLCQGAQYTFNAWLLTVNLQNSLESGDNTPSANGGSGPYKWVNVTFLVYNALTNQLIDSVNTADVAMNLGNPNSWKQYGFTFKSPPNVGSVKVVMRNNGQGGSGNDLAIDDIQFTYCGPQLITTLKDSTATGDTVCAGNPLTLQATINPQNYFNNVQYQWQVSKDGTNWDSIPNSNNALLNLSTLSTDTTHAIYYRFIAADSGNIGVSTCISPSNTFSLLVLKSPNISPKDTTICLGGTATLSAQVGYTNYKWSTGATTSSIRVSPATTTIYKVSATLTTPGLGSCTDSATATVTVFNSLLLNLGNDTSICQGGSLVLNAAIPGATQYLWSTGATTPTITVSTSGKYWVKASYGNYCFASDTINVTVNPLPTVTASAPANVCAGSGIQLTATNTTATKFSWTGPNNFGSSLKNPLIINPSTTAGGVYTVNATDTNGCSNNASATVAVNPLPVVIDTITNVSCFGAKNGRIALNVTGGAPSYSYLWNNGLTTPAISSLDTGHYSVTVTDAKGCNAAIAATVTQPVKLSVSATVDSVTCFGAKNGKVVLNVTGGTGLYTYLWSNDSTSSSISHADTGHYSVIVTDAHGCTAFDTVVVFQPAKLFVTATVDSVSCFGAKDGKVTLNVTGGTLSYSYLWNNSFTTASISSLDTGRYSVIVKDANGCTAFDTAVVFQPAKLSVTATVDIVSCFGAKNGKVTLNVIGGTGPYTYLWSNGLKIPAISSLDTGRYSVIVTDAHGCTAFDTVTVSQPAKLSVTATVDSVSCFGAKNGKVTLNVIGGTGTYTYLWNNGANTSTISSLDTGRYSVIVTDAHGCTAFDTVTVFQPAKLSITATIDSVSCFGAKNGTVALNVTGGTLSYSYLWNNSLTTSSISSLDTGRYSVIVTDAHGCTAFDTATVFQPGKLTITATVDSVTCFGTKNGKVVLNVIGGTGTYTYLWNNGATTSTISSLDTGHYSVIVKDAHGCTAFDTVTVFQPAKLSITATIDGVTCFGTKNGKVVLNVTGGTGTYTYLWNNGATTATISSLDTGHYSVIVKDVNGCAAFDTVIVSQPAKLSVTATIDSVTCFGAKNGKVVLNVTGGTGTYTYLWNNGATTATISSLDTGHYSVIVKDAHGCAAFDTVTVFQPAKLSVTANVDSVSCFGAKNGKIMLVVNGGTRPYSYLWNNNLTTSSISSLDTGRYSVIVTDAHGCTAFDTVTVSQPAKLSVTATVDSVSCFGAKNGTVALNVTGGTGLYSYLWNNGATTATISSLDTGHYSVIVKDAHGCTAFDTVTVFQPAKLSVTATVDSVSCFGAKDGKVALNVTGGTGTYTFLWNNNLTTSSISSLDTGHYSVIVKDVNGCTAFDTVIIFQPAKLSITATIDSVTCFGAKNGKVVLNVTGGTPSNSYLWNNSLTTSSISSLDTGRYSVVVTDAHGCTAFDTVVVNQPAKLTTSHSITNVSCSGGNDGAVNLTPGGGTIPYTYLWNNGATTQNLPNVVAGTYTVIVKDANGCTAYDTATVTQPAKLIASHSITNVSCNGGNSGAINLTVSGGTGSYTYNWSNGATTQNLPNLVTGTYSVIVKDANGCTAYDTATVTQPAKLTSSHSITNVSCNGGNSGAINLTIAGGTGSYTYNWSNGVTSQNLSNLIAGTYSVIVKDANGCTAYDTATVTQPAKLTSSHSIINVSCNGGNNGAVNLIPGGGTTPYTYLWNNGATTQSVSNLVAGTYSVIVKDANGCTAYDTATVTQPARLTISHAIANITCFGSNNGAITLNVTGGTGAYTFTWNNKAASQDISGLNAGKYSVIITDANGCTATDSAVITQPALLTAAASAIPITCYGLSNGSIRITASGGTAPYQYSLDGTNFQGSNTFNGLAPGRYIAIVRDGNSCTTTTQVAITQPDSLEVSDAVTNVSCYGGNNGAVSLKVTGGTAPYTFAWNNHAPAQNITGLTASSYIASITDANGCNARDTAIVSQPPILAFSAGTIPVKCNGGNDGAIIISPSGGTTPYQYSLDGRNFQNNNRFNNLTANTYTVTVRDANGCSISAVEYLTTLAPPSIPTVTAGAVCGGGNITLKAAGAQANEDYRWYGDSTAGALLQTNGNIYTTYPLGQTATFYTTIYNTITGCESPRVPVIAAVHPLPLVTATGGTACEGGTVQLRSSGGSSYRWTGPGFSSGEQNPAISQIAPGAAGIYTVIATDANGCSNTATAPVAVDLPPVIRLGNDTLLVEGTPHVLDAGNPGAIYRWSTEATSRQITVDSAGTYRVAVSHGACTVEDSIHIRYFTAPVINFSRDTTLCTGTPLTLKANNPNSTYLWNDGSTADTLTATQPGEYWVRIKKFTAIVSDTIHLHYLPMPAVNLSGDTTLCEGTPLTLDAGVAGLSYYWNTQERTQKISVNAPGDYWVVASNGACIARGSIRVSYDPLPAVDLPADTTICRGESLTLNAYNPGAAYLWSNGDTTASVTVNTQDTFAVMVTRGACVVRNSTRLFLNPPPNISLRKDTVLCDGQSLLLNAGSSISTSYRWNDGSSDPVKIISAPGQYWVLAAYGICIARDTINVSLRNPPTVQLGSDVHICTGEKVVLRPNLKKALFTWNDKSSGDSLTVTQPGKYWLTAIDLECNTVSSDTINVTVNGPPAVTLGNDTAICKGEYITLIPKAKDIMDYRWQDGSSDSSFRTNEAGIYSVTVANKCGYNSADIRIRTTDCSVTGDLYIPNAFTPNHDGNNDLFRPKHFVTITYFEMFVYNRWGQMVCRTQNIDKGWDGTFNGQPCDLGTYVWYIRYKKQNDPKEYFKKGDVILIR